MEAKYQGRLELTWTNKHKRLLAQPDGTCEWVTPADYRVAEIRLLLSPSNSVSGDTITAFKVASTCRRNSIGCRRKR